LGTLIGQRNSDMADAQMCSALEVAGCDVISASADIAIEMDNSVDDKPAASSDLALDQNVDVPDFPELTTLAVVDDG